MIYFILILALFFSGELTASNPLEAGGSEKRGNRPPIIAETEHQLSAEAQDIAHAIEGSTLTLALVNRFLNKEETTIENINDRVRLFFSFRKNVQEQQVKLIFRTGIFKSEDNAIEKATIQEIENSVAGLHLMIKLAISCRQEHASEIHDFIRLINWLNPSLYEKDATINGSIESSIEVLHGGIHTYFKDPGAVQKELTALEQLTAQAKEDQIDQWLTSKMELTIINKFEENLENDMEDAYSDWKQGTQIISDPLHSSGEPLRIAIKNKQEYLFRFVEKFIAENAQRSYVSDRELKKAFRALRFLEYGNSALHETCENKRHELVKHFYSEMMKSVNHAASMASYPDYDKPGQKNALEWFDMLNSYEFKGKEKHSHELREATKKFEQMRKQNQKKQLNQAAPTDGANSVEDAGNKGSPDQDRKRRSKQSSFLSPGKVIPAAIVFAVAVCFWQKHTANKKSITSKQKQP